MYEELKNYKTATELVLMLLKLDGEISALGAAEALKDHPLKPGRRGIAQAIQRVYERFSPVMRKFRRGKEAFYHFVNPDLRKIELKDLYNIYLRKETFDNLIGESMPNTSTNVEQIQILNKKYDEMIKSLDQISKMINFILNKETTVKSQRVDIHFYIHFGKEG